MARRVLIVGGGGFIGAHLARARAAAGDDVHVLVRPSTDCWRLDGVAGLFRHAVPLTDRAALAACLARVRADEVYYLVASTRAAFDRAGAADLAALVATELAPLVALIDVVGRMADPPAAFVRAGSLAEYGGARLYREDVREVPLSPYQANLVAGTHFLQMLQPRLATRLVTARLALVYGPMQPTSFLVPHLLERLAARREVTLDRPDDVRDVIHVDDAAEGLCALAAAPAAAGQVVNLSSGVRRTVLEIARAVARHVAAPERLIRLAQAPAARRDATPDFVAEPDLLRTLVGWAPAVTLAEGLARTVPGNTAKQLEEVAA